MQNSSCHSCHSSFKQTRQSEAQIRKRSILSDYSIETGMSLHPIKHRQSFTLLHVFSASHVPKHVCMNEIQEQAKSEQHLNVKILVFHHNNGTKKLEMYQTHEQLHS